MKSPQYQLRVSSTPRGEIIAKFMKSPHSTKIIMLYQIIRMVRKSVITFPTKNLDEFVVRFSPRLTKHQKDMSRLNYTITNQVYCF